MTMLRLRSAGLTHTGHVRSANEDALLAREREGVWLVADGMGGHANGRWASAAVAEAVGVAPLNGSFEADLQALTDALHAANARIHDASVAEGARMGSTAALLLADETRFACLWVGDSRIYLRRDGEIRRLTRDHTQVQEMVDRGLLTSAEARHHPMSHILSRAVGSERRLELGRTVGAHRPGDAFLLCSDGLTACVDDGEICAHLSEDDVEAACRYLLDLTLSRGAPDNISIAIVRGEASVVPAENHGTGEAERTRTEKIH